MYNISSDYLNPKFPFLNQSVKIHLSAKVETLVSTERYKGRQKELSYMNVQDSVTTIDNIE